VLAPVNPGAADRVHAMAAASGHGHDRTGEHRAGTWIAIGPAAVLASWLALVFVPPAYRMQALYACVALLSVAAFAMAFYLTSRTGARAARSARAREPEPLSAPTAAAPSLSLDGPAEAHDAADAPDEGDARFRLVVEAAPNAMIMIDVRGNIQLLNSQAERLFGYERSQLLGKSIEVLLPPYLRAIHRAVRAAYMRTPETRRMGAGRDLFGLRRDGVEIPIEIGLNPISTRAGSFVLASIIDITERKRAEQALRASEERFRLLVEDAPNAMIMVDAAGKIALLNGEAERLFGYERAELVGKPIESLLPERLGAEHSRLRGEYLLAPRVRTMGAGRDLYGVRRDGTEVPVEIGLNPIRTAEGTFVLASVVDITERKRAQEQIRAALMEKTLLLDEIHHRVKNNLQVITSLLNLQAGRARDPAVRASISESRDRVQAMALIHQLLFERRDWSLVQLAPYLRRLADLLSSTYGRGRVQLDVEADEVELDVQRAVPCGLLVNELVTNAFKHAFPREATGRISVELRREDDGHARLRVSDSGRGLPENLDLERVESLGMQLIPLLADQVRGTLHIERGPGASFELRFPIATAGAET
jgi:PAS domain S-box-containing protein